MKRLHRYLVASFLPALLGGLAFFVLVLQIMELLPNIAKFINSDARLIDVSKMMLFYLPKCVSYALPIAILFAVSFSLGSMYAKNELIAVLNSGISLYSFTIPLVAIGILLSFSSFFFEDRVVIDSFRIKNETYRKIMKQSVSANNNEITVMSHNGDIVYQVAFYNAAEKSLQGIVVVERDAAGAFVSRINAERAVWENEAWTFQRVRRYYWKPDKSSVTDAYLPAYQQPNLDEEPDTFSKSRMSIEEMKIPDAKKYIAQLKRAGFPYNGEEAEYYKRFAFALTPLIVILISITMGGRFKKNILLMSGLASLFIATAYYILQMITMIFAKLGYMNPLAGAWLPFLIFFSCSLFLYRHAKT
jgi:lipopolysaccharide export system permease protein